MFSSPLGPECFEMSEQRKSVTISMENSLFNEIESLRRELGYSTRSKVYQDALVDFITSKSEEMGEEDTIAIISILFDHDDPELQNALTNSQHSYPPQVLFSNHVHLTPSLCIDILFARGTASALGNLCDNFSRFEGVKYVGRMLIPTGLLNEDVFPFLNYIHNHQK